MRPDAANERESLALGLEEALAGLHRLCARHPEALADPQHQHRLTFALGEIAGLVYDLAPDLALDSLDEARCVPETWAHTLHFGKVEGVSVLRRRHIDGRASGLFALDVRRCGLVMLLDDGGVGWQPPELGALTDPPSPEVTTDELTWFVTQAKQLVAFLSTALDRRVK